MPSELNGLHIRHEFRGKAKITSSCGGQGRPHRGRRASEPGLEGRLLLDWQEEGLMLTDGGGGTPTLRVNEAMHAY